MEQCLEHKFIAHPLLSSIIFCERCGEPKKLSLPSYRPQRIIEPPDESAEPQVFRDMTDRDLEASARANEAAALEMARALRDEGLIPGGSGLYHPDDEPPADDVDEADDRFPPRDPDDERYRRAQDESDTLAPNARFE